MYQKRGGQNDKSRNSHEEITDVDYNGREIWLTNIYNERYRVNQAYVDENMTLAFVEQFTQRIANVVSQQFNKQNPELEVLPDC